MGALAAVAAVAAVATSAQGGMALALICAVVLMAAIALMEPIARAVRRQLAALEALNNLLQAQLLLAEHPQSVAERVAQPAPPSAGQQKFQSLWAALPAGVVVEAPSGEKRCRKHPSRPPRKQSPLSARRTVSTTARCG